jgi:hypothetical protein
MNINSTHQQTTATTQIPAKIRYTEENDDQQQMVFQIIF